MAFQRNDPEITRELVEWAQKRRSGNPRCTDDLEEQCADVLAGAAESRRMGRRVDTVFAGTEEERAERGDNPIGAVVSSEDEAPADVAQEVDKGAESLEALPLPGKPKGQDRKVKWLAVPRRARVAIRRLRRNFRRLPSDALAQILRAANAPKANVETATTHRRAVCEQIKPLPPTSTASSPKPFVLNREVGPDVVGVRDAAGIFYNALNCVDYGATLEQVSSRAEPRTTAYPCRRSVWVRLRTVCFDL